MKIIYKIISNFINNKSLYIGEKVTMSEHMIQSAMLAEKAKCSDDLICACLLHDYGHFLLEDPDELVKNKLDGEHENIGYQYLKKFFGQKIVEPIKYHVLAKRYLARDIKYFDFLSDASKISLKLQGGVLNDKESKKLKLGFSVVGNSRVAQTIKLVRLGDFLNLKSSLEDALTYLKA